MAGDLPSVEPGRWKIFVSFSMPSIIAGNSRKHITRLKRPHQIETILRCCKAGRPYAGNEQRQYVSHVSRREAIVGCLLETCSIAELRDGCTGSSVCVTLSSHFQLILA
jgi:hypothetical protein